MPRFHRDLPQMEQKLFLTDAGIETDLIFNKGVELPDFAAFTLLADRDGRRMLDTYFREIAAVAAESGAGFVLESPTWRANPDWASRLGYDTAMLAEVQRQAIQMLVEIRDDPSAPEPVVISGCVGPRGEGYLPAELMSDVEAHRYHQVQVNMLADTDADMVTALTIGYAAEAVGIARAARDSGVPVALSFTVETDGSLPDGTSPAEAITCVDDATQGYPAYYMINCAHPTHFAKMLDPQAEWTRRIRGVRANASRQSHAELEEEPMRDASDPTEFGRLNLELRSAVPHLSILGGCCGTDVRHIRAIANACLGG
jgi:S-methylmethionine-dependent homocysteine/selenocysteine methylase